MDACDLSPDGNFRQFFQGTESKSDHFTHLHHVAHGGHHGAFGAKVGDTRLKILGARVQPRGDETPDAEGLALLIVSSHPDSGGFQFPEEPAF